MWCLEVMTAGRGMGAGASRKGPCRRDDVDTEGHREQDTGR